MMACDEDRYRILSVTRLVLAGQDSPPPPTRLDPLVDRHPSNRASRVQETGRHSGADGSVVTGTPNWPLL